jgi:diguanylate cyclase (GGDEF)-like protein
VTSAIEQARMEQQFERQQRELERLGQLVLRDSLTSLYNHRHFQDALRTEVARARRYQQPLGLLFIDVDHFKNFNDRAGHPAGDRLLVQLARILDNTGDVTRELPLRARACDFVARYGGEEFVMILPHTDAEGAAIKATRIRRAVAEFPFAHRDVQPDKQVTISVGVASADFPTQPHTAESLIEAADKALYAAKTARNQVHFARPDGEFFHVPDTQGAARAAG